MKVIITYNHYYLNRENIHNAIIFTMLDITFNTFKFKFVKSGKIHNTKSYAEIQKFHNQYMKYYYIHNQYLGYHGNVTHKMFKKLKNNIIRKNKLKVFL